MKARLYHNKKGYVLVGTFKVKGCAIRSNDTINLIFRFKNETSKAYDIIRFFFECELVVPDNTIIIKYDHLHLNLFIDP